MKKASLVIICLLALLVVYGFATITVAHADNGRPYFGGSVEPLDNGRPYLTAK